MEAIASAAQLAELPARRRAIRLRALKCRFPPYLAFDGEATEPEEPSLRTVDTSRVDQAKASETEATVERAYLVSLPATEATAEVQLTELQPMVAMPLADLSGSAQRQGVRS